MAFGYMDTQYVDLPQGIDQQYLDGLENESGQSFNDIIRAVDARLTDFNNGVDPLLATLLYRTQDAVVLPEATRPMDVQPKGEYGVSRVQRVENYPGWMLPIEEWEASVGWTEKGLKRQRLQTTISQLDSLLLGFRVRFRKEVFRRLLSDAEVRVDQYTPNLSPGFAGSGTGLNVYTIPYPNGEALPGGYTHYVRTAAASLATALDGAIDKLKRQGHQPPYDLIGSSTAITAVKALTGTEGFVGVGSPLVRLDPEVAEALVDASTYDGVVRNVIRVRPYLDDWSSANLVVYKSYGANDPRNPLHVRYPDRPNDPDSGFSAYLRSRSLYPLDQAIVLHEWGVGVGNRTAAVNIYIAESGGYVAPTFS
jgi:hypothetical protein